MIVSDAFRGKRYAVLGLARSGLATVRALVASGAHVVAWDSREEAREVLEESLSPSGERLGEGAVKRNQGASDSPPSQPSPLKGGGLSLTLADPLTIDLAGFDGVVVSPGVPINRHPIGDKARAAGVPLIGDIELFAQARASLPLHKVVGITGTNGKSTTTALIHHILKTAGVPTTMGGNIGLPILGQDPLPAGGVYVLELSSYQIDLTFSLNCDVAIILNVTPDHLDRYSGFSAYAASKVRLFQMSTHWCFDMRIFRDHTVQRQEEWPALQGPHNLENAIAARNVVSCLLGNRARFRQDGAKAVIEAALRTYPGLPHRMERIRELDGVLYVNDSKGTNAEATAPALAAYPALHWILGGVAKTKELDACAPHFKNVRAAYTIGEAGPMFADLLRPHMPVTNSGTLGQAVLDARKAAKPGEAVLLSPACASFDQFRDFEARGDAFRVLVEALT